jgi:LacI family transcriptional regulator
MAVGLLRRLQLENIAVPDTIAVASYDDLPFAATSSPSLTTVRQPLEAMGRVAAGLLMDMVQQHDPSPRRILLPTQLITRESCGMVGKGVMPRSKLTN